RVVRRLPTHVEISDKITNLGNGDIGVRVRHRTRVAIQLFPTSSPAHAVVYLHGLQVPVDKLKLGSRTDRYTPGGSYPENPSSYIGRIPPPQTSQIGLIGPTPQSSGVALLARDDLFRVHSRNEVRNFSGAGALGLPSHVVEVALRDDSFALPSV